MSVYVDDALIPYGRMVMCHMFADTPEELRDMARQIGVGKWPQWVGTYKEHFDICKSKRAQAVDLGALEITYRDVARLLRQRRTGVHDPKFPAPRPATSAASVAGRFGSDT